MQNNTNRANEQTEFKQQSLDQSILDVYNEVEDYIQKEKVKINAESVLMLLARTMVCTGRLTNLEGKQKKTVALKVMNKIIDHASLSSNNKNMLKLMMNSGVDTLYGSWHGDYNFRDVNAEDVQNVMVKTGCLQACLEMIMSKKKKQKNKDKNQTKSNN